MTPHLCHVFPSFGTGGPEVRTAQLINALGNAYRHTIVALNSLFTGRERLDAPDSVPMVPGPVRRGRLRHPVDLARLLRSLAPDAVLTYGWGGTDGILAARLAGMRRVLHGEDGFLPEEADREKGPRRLARRVLLNLSAGVVVPSQLLVRRCARSWRLPAAKVHYVPNGIDLQRFAPPTPVEAAAARRRFGLPPAALVVGTVGRFGPEKNQGRLVRAFAAAAGQGPAVLLLAGDGPMRAAVQAQAEAAGLTGRVHFTGNLADPLACYQAMDVFTLSSDTEQMPLALLEAMAAGLPVVSTDVGDVREMVAEENRELVVSPADESAFAARLAALLENSALRHRLGAANRARCQQRFGMGKMISAYRLLYDNLLQA